MDCLNFLLYQQTIQAVTIAAMRSHHNRLFLVQANADVDFEAVILYSFFFWWNANVSPDRTSQAASIFHWNVRCTQKTCCLTCLQSRTLHIENNKDGIVPLVSDQQTFKARTSHYSHI